MKKNNLKLKILTSISSGHKPGSEPKSRRPHIIPSFLLCSPKELTPRPSRWRSLQLNGRQFSPTLSETEKQKSEGEERLGRCRGGGRNFHLWEVVTPESWRFSPRLGLGKCVRGIFALPLFPCPKGSHLLAEWISAPPPFSPPPLLVPAPLPTFLCSKAAHLLQASIGIEVVVPKSPIG